MEQYIAKVNEKANKKVAVLKKHQAGHVPLSLVIFKKYDKDGDGALSPKEFKEFTEDKGYFLSELDFNTAFA